MNPISILAYAMGTIALAASCFIYAEYIYLLGFPDGFITELGYAQRKLAYAFILVSTVLGLYFIYLGTVAVRREINKRLLVAIGLYTLLASSVIIINFYYRLHLNSIGFNF